MKFLKQEFDLVRDQEVPPRGESLQHWAYEISMFSTRFLA